MKGCFGVEKGAKVSNQLRLVRTLSKASAVGRSFGSYKLVRKFAMHMNLHNRTEQKVSVSTLVRHLATKSLNSLLHLEDSVRRGGGRLGIMKMARMG